MKINVNGTEHDVDVDGAMPVLWVLRDVLDLTGTKFGCGIARCGACTVHLDGSPIRACVTPVREIEGKELTTIEGLGGEHPVQQAWIEHAVPQCGYCQVGQIMSTVALLNANPSPNDAEVKQALAGNLCRCGTYPRIRKAIAGLSE